MERFFNTTGPVVAGEHYLIPPLSRVDWEEIQFLIKSKRYFVLHAPRQTGKTSTLLAMTESLNEQGRYQTLYVNIEAAQAVGGDAAKGMALICQTIANTARTNCIEPPLVELTREILRDNSPEGALTELLTRWSENSAKPIVLLLDEVDALVGDTRISLLRQIRAGYTQRPHAFPQSIVLCGVRDVRDYRMHSGGREVITGGSVFNIKAESLRVSNFTTQEVRHLYQQHTDDTGQTFNGEIFPAIWADTEGQPWLVNALGYALTRKNKSLRDRAIDITAQHYQTARESLIRSHATHLDQLTDKLQEPRIHKITAALLSGAQHLVGVRENDLQYVEDLGLIVRKPHIRIANRIYREIIPREITAPIQDGIPYQQAWYLTPQHHLDMPKLLAAFQQFFQQHSVVWLQDISYKEAGPYLLLQAFLQRILYSRGRINRVYALGRERTDLFIEWPVDEEKGFDGVVQRIAIQLKIQQDSLDAVLTDGLQQTAEYYQQSGAQEAHLVIFNRRHDIQWDDKIWRRNEVVSGITVNVWGV